MNFLKLFSTLLIFSILHLTVLPILSVDKYYNFPQVSVKGSATFEKKRKICLFPFRTNQKEEKFAYLSKGIPSVLISELRNLEFIYVEYPHPEIIYHSLGPKPEKSLEEMIDSKTETLKRKKKEIKSEAELDELRKSKRFLPPTQDPRYVKVDIKQITEIKPPFAEDIYSLAMKFDCNYSITGDFFATDTNIKVNVELFDEFEGKIEKFVHETSFVRGYQEMAPLGEKIKFFLQGKESTLVQIETIGLENSLVYLDGIYLGKTPVTNKKFPIGKRELFVFQEGYVPFKKEIELESGKTFSLDVKLNKIQNTSFISVKSDIEEADVFLGVTYLGKTPLTKVSIPAGLNRLRISKQGYVDVFRAVDAKAEEVSEYDVFMREGKSEIYYPNKQYVFLDYTYKDFATYSLYGSLLFYASYFYLNLASRKAIEDSRPLVTLVSGQTILTYYNGNSANDFAAWYLYQNSVIESSESRADYYKTMAGTLPTENRRDRQLVGGPMVIGMGVMLAAAVTFLVLGLDDESFDMGYAPMAPGGFAGAMASQSGSLKSDSYSYFQYNTRF